MLLLLLLLAPSRLFRVGEVHGEGVLLLLVHIPQWGDNSKCNCEVGRGGVELGR